MGSRGSAESAAKAGSAESAAKAGHAAKVPHVYFLAHPLLRTFPRRGPIGPQHINGGYTYPSRLDVILIYRAEDATRVLIHELQHAYGLDDHRMNLDKVEAETEAWAELLYHAILSKGNKKAFSHHLREQARWMHAQNQRVAAHLKTPTQFPYRYTLAKEDVWKRWGLTSPSNQTCSSLRLTVPPSAAMKKAYGRSNEDTIL